MKIILLFLISSSLWAADYTLIFTKSNQTLQVVKDKTIIKTLPFVYGKKEGKKQKRGDLKTPEGTYQVLKQLKRKWIKSRYANYREYGAGALTLNYPNQTDRKNKATGGGIWIHGTDYPERLKTKNITRGCLVLANKDIKYLLETIPTKTQVIIKP